MELGPPVGVEVVNDSQKTIWVAAKPTDGAVLQLEPGESDTTCFLQASAVLVLQIDPMVDHRWGLGSRSSGVDGTSAPARMSGTARCSDADALTIGGFRPFFESL